VVVVDEKRLERRVEPVVEDSRRHVDNVDRARSRRDEVGPCELVAGLWKSIAGAADEAAARHAFLAEEAHAARLAAEEAARAAAEEALTAYTARTAAEETVREQAEALETSVAAEVESRGAAADQAEAARVAHAARAVADEAALEQAQRAHGERAAAEEGAQLAHQARLAAEEDAWAQAELAGAAAAERTAAEERTRRVLEEAAAAAARHREELEEAVRARIEAEQAVAEQAAARLEAEQAAEQRAVDRGAVEAVVRHHTEVAEGVIQDRIAAEQRAGELADELADARAQLLDGASGPGRGLLRRGRSHPASSTSDPESAFFPFGNRHDTSERIEAIRDETPPPAALDDPEGARMFVAPGPPAAQMLALLVVAGLAAVASAYSLIGGHLFGPLGIVSVLVLVAAVVVAVRLRASVAQIGIHGGIVTLVLRGSHHRFDLTNPAIEIELQGTPDHRDWRVLFLRRALPPLVIDDRMVDSVAFTSALRKWRPDL
ncbi:MAG: hypothetical protein JWO11_262, partial [Nocardioides sp.]|nr:hypothetical protein [Nocardioides sp.]